MPKKPQKVDFPFMVFHEAFNLPDGSNRIDRLHDPKTPAEERDEIRRDFKTSLETVEQIENRNTQTERHAANHQLRDRVMAGLQVDACGKPKRGEPKRLADLHGLPIRKVRKWIEQLRNKSAISPSTWRSEWDTADWQTVYYGEALREQNRVAARAKKKSKG